jgi:hypothetical protein
MKKKISRRKLINDAAHAGMPAAFLPLSGFADVKGKINGLIMAGKKSGYNRLATYFY